MADTSWPIRHGGYLTTTHSTSARSNIHTVNSHGAVREESRAPPATMRRVKHATRAISLGVVLACVVGTMAVGTALKYRCAAGNYDGRQYRDLCYSDIVPL